MAVDFLEHDEQRLRRRLKAIGGGSFSPDEVTRLVAGDLSVVEDKPRRIKRAVVPLIKQSDALVPRGELEQMVGSSLDLVPIAYLSEARRAADAVCRVTSRDRRAKGTGFLVAEGMLLTNHHVITDESSATGMLAQFDYELNNDFEEIPTTEFLLDPDRFFWTSPVDELDITIVAVGDAHSGEMSKSAADYGACPLLGTEDKHAVGDYVTVVQHPDGDFKQIAVRDNRVLGRGQGGVTLHYASDTLPGSSGSPVFNDEFVLVAVHHAGGPRLESMLDTGEAVPAESNEGIRVSSIVARLQAAAAGLGPRQVEVLASITGPL